MRDKLLLLAAMVAAVALYWLGLSGPFLFDDRLNLLVVQQWLDGDTSWLGAVIGSRGWLEARPVSMASFTLTAWLGGGDSYSYKLGNLGLHLMCGMLAWLLIRRVLHRDSALSTRAALFASVTVGLWLVHPLHVSTVLYAVQRMAQLSALFVLASLLVYISAREALIASKQHQGIAGLFVLFPLLVVAGLFSKQNAAVAPGLCLVLELAYFQRRVPIGRPVQAFFAVFLAAPALALGALLAIAPNRLLAAYAEWDFTLPERLMSQARALTDYAGMLLLPRGPRMGLYTDDFVTSTGLMSPPTTLLAILALAIISILAWLLRKRIASLFAGWFFFLVAHGIESSFIPVELYYEHRNYLPALGLLLAGAATADALLRAMRSDSLRPARVGVTVAIAFAAALCFATLGRVQIWRSMDTIAEQAVSNRPASLRAAQTKAMLLGGKRRFDEGIATLEPFAVSSDPRHRLLAGIDILTIRCVRDRTVDPAEFDRLLVNARSRVTVGEVLAIRLLQRVSLSAGCGRLIDDVIAEKAMAIINSAYRQPDSAPPKAQLRLIAAVGFARGGRLPEAVTQAEIAWHATSELAAGDLLARLYLQSGALPEAAQMIDALTTKIRSWDALGQAQLHSLRTMQADASRAR